MFFAQLIITMLSAVAIGYVLLFHFKSLAVAVGVMLLLAAASAPGISSRTSRRPPSSGKP